MPSKSPPEQGFPVAQSSIGAPPEVPIASQHAIEPGESAIEPPSYTVPYGAIKLAIDNRRRAQRQAALVNFAASVPVFGWSESVSAVLKTLSKRHRKNFKDYLNTSSRAGIDPIPVTPAKLESGRAYLEDEGNSHHRQRRAEWERALDSLAPETQAQFIAPGEPLNDARPRVSRYTGIFSELEQELDGWQAKAIRPATGYTDVHDPDGNCLIGRGP